MPSSVLVGGIRMSVITTFGRCSSTARRSEPRSGQYSRTSTSSPSRSRRAARDEADTVVAHRETHRLPIAPEPQRGGRLVSAVLGDVLERFEAAVVDRGLAVLRQPPDILEIDAERHRGPTRDLAE